MSKYTCASCDRALPSEDAICTYCEEEFTLKPTTGQYRCPSCTTRFDDPTMAYFPADAKWYLPRTLHPSCPHCLTFLRDRKSSPILRGLTFASLAFWFIANTFRFPIGVALFGAIATVATVLYAHNRAESAVKLEEERYAKK